MAFREGEQVFTWLGEAWLKFKFSYLNMPRGKEMLFAPMLLPQSSQGTGGAGWDRES